MKTTLLDALLESVRGVFYNDSTRPGVVLSDLGCGQTYASIVRYPNGPDSKQVVLSVKDLDTNRAIQSLALAWIGHRGRSRTLRLNLGEDERKFVRALRAAL